MKNANKDNGKSRALSIQNRHISMGRAVILSLRRIFLNSSHFRKCERVFTHVAKKILRQSLRMTCYEKRRSVFACVRHLFQIREGSMYPDPFSKNADAFLRGDKLRTLLSSAHK